ncbi:hypothetical protein D3874_16540 [Oleomonas cavernae]|uniref:RcnB family protein n=1 Tax=Oleomonas cavernae TaxID=2320859 RepID=A0A418WEL0_9PROT|nr:hypothetical protein [Oleomonas cavernae]RJF88424.1 hypothetical protein D3874_16540 [Oleomonas cavernae]
MNSRIVVAALLAFTLVAPAQVVGKPKNPGQGHGNADTTDSVGEAVGGAVAAALFGASDRQLISNYFLRNSGYLDGLPPGIRKQLVTKGRLPPGIAKKALPPGLAGQLSPLPSGFDRMIIGPDVLLVEIATGIIVDIIRDVVR